MDAGDQPRQWAGQAGCCRAATAGDLPWAHGRRPCAVALQLLSDVRSHAGLLLERGLDDGFIHLTFQEYLAAIAVAQTGQSDLSPVVNSGAADGRSTLA